EARRLFAEQIDERITRARNRLPLDVGSPLAPHALVVRAAVRAPNVDAHQLRRDAENLGRDLPVHRISANAHVSHEVARRKLPSRSKNNSAPDSPVPIWRSPKATPHPTRTSPRRLGLWRENFFHPEIATRRCSTS